MRVFGSAGFGRGTRETGKLKRMVGSYPTKVVKVGCAPSNAGVAHPSGQTPKKLTLEARVLKGQNLRLQGQYDAALKELGQVIKEDGNMARAFLERGNVHLEQKCWEEAVNDLTLAIKLQDNFVMGYYMRALALLHLQRFDEAVKDYVEALKLDPENAQVQSLRAHIKKARQEAKMNRSRGSPLRKGQCGVTLDTKNLGCDDDDEDPFYGLDTPKNGTDGNKQKLCLGGVILDTMNLGCDDDDEDLFDGLDTPFDGLDTPKNGTDGTKHKLYLVCLDNERSCRLRPCLHAALCVECAEDLRDRKYGCPICGVTIDSMEVGAFLHTYAQEEAQACISQIAKNTFHSPTATSRRGANPMLGTGTLELNSFLQRVEETVEEGEGSIRNAAVNEASTQNAAVDVEPTQNGAVDVEPTQNGAVDVDPTLNAAAVVGTTLEGAVDVESSAQGAVEERASGQGTAGGRATKKGAQLKQHPKVPGGQRHPEAAQLKQHPKVPGRQCHPAAAQLKQHPKFVQVVHKLIGAIDRGGPKEKLSTKGFGH
eukprot:gene17032-23324_t